MLGRFIPAVTIAAQKLNDSNHKRKAPELNGKAGPPKNRFAALQKGSAPVSSPFAEAGSSNVKQGKATASTPVSLTLPGPMAAQGIFEQKSEPIFNIQDQEKIKAGKKVFLAGFSSQGSGHTERMMKPLGQAVSKGDTVVLVLPPHWENDKKNEAEQLETYSKVYTEAGANVVTVQSDKTIWGFYKEDGPSDNFRILEEFANKPKRDSSQTPLYGLVGDKARTGQGYKHKDIAQQVVDIVGKEKVGQITVFEDMDPYLGKAAAGAGIPKDQIVGQSNHVLLLDADEYFDGKSDAFLVKANGNGFNGLMATVDYDATVNKTASLGETLDELGLQPEDSAADVRRRMVGTLMEHGNKTYPDETNPVDKSGSVMVSRDATAESIDRGVFLYLNKYTESLAEHIKLRLSGGGDTTPEQQAAYEKAMFVVCGGGAFTKDYKADDSNVTNALHMTQAASFDGITAAGFGTTSEMQYLVENDAYPGNFAVMPVEQQHEQEANAHVLLPAGLSSGNQDRIGAATNAENLKSEIDNLVTDKATTTEKLEKDGTTMEPLLTATHKHGSIADKAAALLQGTGGMSEQDARLLIENNWRAVEAGRKEIRQLNKVMIPVLEAMYRGESTATVRLTEKGNEVTVDVAEVAAGLGNPKTLEELTGVKITNQLSRNLSEKLAADLQSLQDQPDAERAGLVDQYRRGEYANDVFILGY